MKIIEVENKRGDTLYGCWYGENFKDTCVILTNGKCGNIFESKFIMVTGELLEKQGISLLYAHNSGAFHRIDTPTKSGKPLGTTYELFDNCIDDLQAFVGFAKKCGYKRIILGGHSYGSNKVIYYLSQNPNEKIDNFLLLSPVDLGFIRKERVESREMLIAIAQKYRNEGRLDEILPYQYIGYNFYTARAFLDFVENKNAKNLPIYSKDSDWKQLKSIKQSGLFVMGENDKFGNGDTFKHLKTINENSRYKNNVIKVIKDCGHSFRGKENELAQTILEFVKE